MQSLKDKFDTVCSRIAEDRRFDSTGSDPIFYLVFPVNEIVDVKRQLRAWIPKLENKGWNAVTFSFAAAINAILRGHRLRNSWLTGEKLLLGRVQGAIPAAATGEINKTLAKALTDGPELLASLREAMTEAGGKPQGVLILTDLEALHPYLRINSIEAAIQGETRCPVIVLYPGKREGKTSLSFLEFYPPDPNYRSEHIG